MKRQKHCSSSEGENINKRILYAVFLGIILYSLLIYLAYIQRDLTIHQLLLITITPLLVGILAGSVKKGAILGFILPLVMFAVEAIVLTGGDPNVVLAIVILSLVYVAISVALGALGGLVGKRIQKK